MKEKLCEMTARYSDQPTTSVTLEMPTELFEHVKKAACLEKSDYQTLINCYVQNGLINNQAQIKRKEFAEHAQEVLKNQGIRPDAITEIFTKFLY
ncbi:MAG: hypothetical protein H8E41_04275 [Desulfobulbaceae bacterium]|uniref:Uncharacterized protein n=1 Tax=Candidatus Desulfobia pelagia TaxID=2841692 RepID=A0A8J6NE20_9BACT|nr:hypothetical protein [Candidatus Desulfobia pelagia]